MRHWDTCVLDGQPIQESNWVRVVVHNHTLSWGGYHDECARQLGVDVESLPVVRSSRALQYGGSARIVRVRLD